MTDNKSSSNPYIPYIPSSAAPEFTGNPVSDELLIAAIKKDERIR